MLKVSNYRGLFSLKGKKIHIGMHLPKQRTSDKHNGVDTKCYGKREREFPSWEILAVSMRDVAFNHFQLVGMHAYCKIHLK